MLEYSLSIKWAFQKPEEPLGICASVKTIFLGLNYTENYFKRISRPLVLVGKFLSSKDSLRLIINFIMCLIYTFRFLSSFFSGLSFLSILLM